MIKKNLQKILPLLLLGTIANAHAEAVLCPPISVIQHAAPQVNFATKFNGTYTVYSEDYVYMQNRVYWRVGADKLLAANDDEALKKGRDLIQHAIAKEQDVAIQINPVEYRCTYTPEHVYALGSKN